MFERSYLLSARGRHVENNTPPGWPRLVFNFFYDVTRTDSIDTFNILDVNLVPRVSLLSSLPPLVVGQGRQRRETLGTRLT